MKFILKYAWAFYLGAILGIADIHIDDLKWWIICVPVAILIQFWKYEKT